SRFCADVAGATCGRSDDAWGPVLRGPLLAFRAYVRRELVGRPVEPRGPRAEPAPTLESFRAAARDGWTTLHATVVALWFVALALLVPRLVRRPWAAALGVATAGLVAWALVYDRLHPCEVDGGDCYRGLVTAFSLAVSTLAWGVALAAAAAVRAVRRRAG